jgi:hypothetical protein
VANDPGVGFAQPRGVWLRQQDGGVELAVMRGNDVNREAFTVEYGTADDTALAGRDYAETRGTLASAAGEMQQTIRVSFLDDRVARPDRTFTVRLSDATGRVAMGTVTNTVAIGDKRETTPHRLGRPHIAADGTALLTRSGGYTPGLGDD